MLTINYLLITVIGYPSVPICPLLKSNANILQLLDSITELILEVARVYGCAGSEAKRCVLRAIEGPIRASAQPAAPLSPALAALLDECPRGAETLLTRLVHIFTEKGNWFYNTSYT